MRPPERIETERLVLRRPSPDDAPAIYRYSSDPDVTRFVQWRPHRDMRDTREFLIRCIGLWNGEERFPFVIMPKGVQTPIGMIEIHSGGCRWGVGYVLAKKFWGRGYTTEALRGVIGWALAQPSVYRMDATCDVENVASYRVMEKAGMQREGLLRRWAIHPNLSPEPRNCFIYATVR